MSETLALNGGGAALRGVKAKQWPPRYAETERELLDLYRTGYWSFGGPREVEFCRRFAAANGSRHCLFMMNGTVTLEAALYVLGIGPGDEVIVPAMTWIATAAAASYNGATPVFVDIDPESLCLDVAQAEAAITPRTKAIIPVHLYGSMVDMDALMALAQRRGLAVIEDCAHAHGGSWNGRSLGTFGPIGSFSFQESKPLACGEGGAVLTDDDELAGLLYRYKHIGYPPPPRPALNAGERYSPAGFVCRNYRATEFQAAILLGQLRRLRQMTAKRAEAADYLRAELTRIPGVRVQAPGRCASPQSYYMFVLLLDLAAFADLPLPTVAKALAAEGLPSKVVYGSVYRHPLWNLTPDAYRVHATGSDTNGACCRVTEELTQCALPIPHHWLLQPMSVLTRTVEAVAKVQRLAGTVA